MEIEYLRQEMKRISLLLGELRELKDEPYWRRLKAIALCLSRSLEEFDGDDFEEILDDIEGMIEEGFEDLWIVLNVLLCYYNVREDELSAEIGGWANRMIVEVDEDLLGKKSGFEVVKRYWDVECEEDWREWYSDLSEYFGDSSCGEE